MSYLGKLKYLLRKVFFRSINITDAGVASSENSFRLRVRESSNDVLRVNVGAARDEYEDWICCDKADFDILEESKWMLIFGENSIDALLAEHVFEHLTEEQITKALTFGLRCLKPGSGWRVAVPDGLFPNKEYIEHVRPLGRGPGADDHKVLLTVHDFLRIGGNVGFEVVPLEYWDDDGAFHRVDWSERDGPIRRAAETDPRNTNGELNYTSLLVDFRKPGVTTEL